MPQFLEVTHAETKRKMLIGVAAIVSMERSMLSSGTYIRLRRNDSFRVLETYEEIREVLRPVLRSP